MNAQPSLITNPFVDSLPFVAASVESACSDRHEQKKPEMVSYIRKDPINCSQAEIYLAIGPAYGIAATTIGHR